MEFTRAGLIAAGFEGFISFEQHKALRDRPRFCGVYVVLRESVGPPVFLPVSPAGSKGEASATATREALSAEWVDGAEVVYIGKAASRKGLHDRLRQFRRHGEGFNASHWGGRYVWQLADAAGLLVCWRETPRDEARRTEERMIAEFVAAYGQRPFANLAD